MEIAPSVLAANFVRLEDEIRDVEQTEQTSFTWMLWMAILYQIFHSARQ